MPTPLEGNPPATGTLLLLRVGDIEMYPGQNNYGRGYLVRYDTLSQSELICTQFY